MVEREGFWFKMLIYQRIALSLFEPENKKGSSQHA